MTDYRNLLFWQKSMDIVTRIYSITSSFPREEQFGLSSQLRRAAVSIPANIAEGCGRESNKDYAHFMRIAIGSLCELECELMIAGKLNFIDSNLLNNLLKETTIIKGMMDAYKNKLIKN